MLELFILTMLAGWCLLTVVLGLSTSRVRHVMSGPAPAASPGAPARGPGDACGWGASRPAVSTDDRPTTAAVLPAATPVRAGGHARTDRRSWLTTKQVREAEVQISLGM